MKTRVSSDERYLVWINGQSNLSIVNISDFTSKEIRFFWKYQNFEMLATSAAINHDATRIVGIGFMDQPRQFQTLHIYDGSDAVTIFETGDVVPEVKAWVCIEVNIEGDVFFVGGSSHTNFDSSEGHLMAFTFDENADIINQHKFGRETGLKVVNCLRRHPEGNILFAGCHGALAVVLWHKKCFSLIKTIKNVVASPITDIAYNFNAVYCVSDHNKAMIVFFDDGKGAISTRDPSLRQEPHGRYKSAIGDGTLAENYRNRTRIPPKHGHLFRDYDIRQINLPGGIINVIFSRDA